MVDIKYLLNQMIRYYDRRFYQCPSLSTIIISLYHLVDSIQIEVKSWCVTLVIFYSIYLNTKSEFFFGNIKIDK